MAEHHAPGRDRDTAQIATAQRHDARQSQHRGKRQPEQGQEGHLPDQRHQNESRHQNRAHQRQFAPDPSEPVPAPAQKRPHRHHRDHRQREDRADGIEIGRADRDAHIERLGQQGIERAEQHHGENRRQEDIVDDQRPLAARDGEPRAFADRARPQREEEERPADIDRQQEEDEGSALGIDGKGVDAGQDARSDEKGAEHTHREGDHPEHDRPGPQGVARGENAGRMQQRRRGEPGHQRRVLDRVPEPPAAPTQLVIGPIAARRDPQCQEHPRAQHPGPHGAGEIRRDLTRDQRADRETEGHGKADIAEIKRGRMEGEPDILQQGIEPCALLRRDRQPLERIGAEQQEGIETQRHETLRGEDGLHHPFGQPPLDHGDQRPRSGQHGHPQQHRAFVIAPRARQLEDHRLQRMRILRHQLHRQIGDGEDIEQRDEGQGCEDTLDDGGGARQVGDAGFCTGLSVRHILPHRKRASHQLQHRQRRGEP